ILVVGEDQSEQIPKIAPPIIFAMAWSIRHQTLPARHMHSSSTFHDSFILASTSVQPLIEGYRVIPVTKSTCRTPES
ncbi:hypothetical protein RSAG8_13551, partial [Rhizoctonia solani AG-8 WAC10335]